MGEGLMLVFVLNREIQHGGGVGELKRGLQKQWEGVRESK
jgi:hypothetical protein